MMNNYLWLLFVKKSPVHKRLLMWVLMLGLIGALSAPAYAGWSVYRRVQLRNTKKHRLRFDRGGEGPIRVWLFLKSHKQGNLKTKPPLYKVDGGPVRNLNAMEGLKAHKTGRWIRWEIDDGKGKPDPALEEFLNGKQVVFQFYRPDGRICETVFELEGLKEAIQKLFD